VTQICDIDVFMYLVAIKSFVRFVRPGGVCVVDDGSLRQRDKNLLRRHVEGIRIAAAHDVSNDRCPRGGCWERLLTIADLVGNGYVIQLDSDTITREEPTEVLQCLEQGRGFVLGTDLGHEVLPVLEARRITAAHSWAERERNHVQVVSELAFADLPDPQTRRYVRGNAAFTGFPRGSIARADVETFSTEMEALVGDKWHNWGSEQVASNYVVANRGGDIRVLNRPRYVYHAPGVEMDPAVFIHFIGSYRFDNGTYARMSRDVVADLLRT
jgi:hypothetical protein